MLPLAQQELDDWSQLNRRLKKVQAAWKLSDADLETLAR